MRKRIGKSDAVVLGVIALACIFLLVFYYGGHGKAGAVAVVTVNGETYGTYPLTKDQVINIQIDGQTTNVLTISDGRADMTDADCKDHLCVNQKAISKDGETIVCLPNKVVVTVESKEESGVDAVAN